MASTQAMSRSVVLGLAVLLCATFAQAQTFPCPALSSNNSTNVAGGYQNLKTSDLSNSNTLDGLNSAINASFVQWIEQDSNFTLCDDINRLVGSVEFGVIQACSQVVAGTNYGLRYLAQYTCVVEDELALGEEQLVLNAVVYVPLPTNGVEAEPQVQEVYLDTDIPVEEGVLPVEIIAISPNSAPASPASPSDNVLSAGPTPSSPANTPYTLEGL